MKKTLLLLSVFITFNALAQQTETIINFDNYVSVSKNDLVNKFTQKYTSFKISENTDNSGYWLSTPLSGDATDPLRTCNKFRLDSGDLLEVSIDFKKERYPTPVSSRDNSIGIFITDDSGETFLSTAINDTYYMFISGLKKTTDYMQFSYQMLDNNWYKLNFKINRNLNNTFTVVASLYDLGSKGLSTPSLKGRINDSGKNYKFKSETGYKIHIAGGLWSNVKYIDNLKIIGVDLGNSCSNLSINELQPNDNINVYPTVTSDFVNINDKKNEVTKIELYNNNGKMVLKTTGQKSINIESQSNGLYLLKIFTENNVSTVKIIKK